MSSDFKHGVIAGLAIALAVVLAIGALAPVRAQALPELSLSVYGLSRHSEPGYCEVNPGLGVNVQLGEDVRAGVARFRMSKCRLSTALGFVYEPLKLGDFRFGLAFLRLTAYRDEAVYVPLPVGSYRVARGEYLDFFAAKKDHLAAVGLAWRLAW